MRISLLLLLISFVSSSVVAEQIQDSLIRVSGQIISLSTKRPIPFAHVTIKRKICVSDSLGYYSIPCHPNDSLNVSAIGYGDTKIPLRLHETNWKFLLIELQATSYQLGEVEIYAFGSYEDFKREFIASKLPEPKFKINESIFSELAPFSSKPPSDIPAMYRNSFREKPNILNAVFAPADFLYYHLSKKEKSKRKIVKMIRQEKKQKKVDTIYNTELIAQITKLKGESLADFVAYCNSKIIVNSESSSYEVTSQIHKLYRQYQNELSAQ